MLDANLCLCYGSVMISDIRRLNSVGRPRSRVIYHRLQSWKRWVEKVRFLQEIKAEVAAACELKRAEAKAMGIGFDPVFWRKI